MSYRYIHLKRKFVMFTGQLLGLCDSVLQSFRYLNFGGNIYETITEIIIGSHNYLGYLNSMALVFIYTGINDK